VDAAHDRGRAVTAPLLLAAGWSAWVLAVARARRPRQVAPDLGDLLDAAAPPARMIPLLARWGASAQARVGVLGELPALVVGVAISCVAVAVVVAPQTGLALGLVVVTVARARSVTRQRERRRRMVAQAPAAIDLLGLCLDAGMSPRQAVVDVCAAIDAPLGDDLVEVVARTARGETLARALDPLSARDHPLRPVALAVASAERTGVPLAGSLDRLAAEARAALRRAGQERARRLPVLMLLPLVLCVLPAFGLVAVVPMLAGRLGGLL
jgi:pilus assembly protein TadC